MTVVSCAPPAIVPATVRYAGQLSDLSQRDRRAMIDRSPSRNGDMIDAVAAIIREVRERGDIALRAMARRFDGVELEALEVPPAVRRKALDILDRDVRRAMERSAGNIERVHRAGMPRSIEVSPERGIVIRRRPDPIDRVGVYAPGGRAAYPSSVLMGVVPARVAGVSEIIVCSPPDRSGSPASVVLAAAELASADRVFAVGGAGAIAAMALGTASIPRVNKIVGPGNAYVAEAKLQVVGTAAIDSPAGPSELLVIADSSANPDRIAIEMIAQAEHDPLACVVALCVGVETARGIEDSLSRLSPGAARANIVAQSLGGQGAVLAVDDIDEALEFVRAYAPEHLMIATVDANAVAMRVRNAGTVFVGERSSVAFGDYMTGANHVLPTGGLARSYSGLTVLDFMRWTTVQEIDGHAAQLIGDDTANFAVAEGLPGHALAARQAGAKS